MKKALFILATLIALTSCGSKYSIQGSSNVPTLDGHKLYLKVLDEDNLKNIDSCEVIHGQFHFKGSIDSPTMAHLYMDEANIMPLVLEDGEIQIKIDLTQQAVSGTPLNDELFSFLNRYNQILSERGELVHKHDQAIMDGSNMEVVNAALIVEERQLAIREDSLVTNFVTSNFDNVLGPGVFFMMTVSNQYPQLDPWIEDIMSKATDSFKNDPYVKDYYEKAQENEKIMNGLRDVSPQATADPSATPAPTATPNDLAKPQP
ncbi:MAG: DUF4369 domain-containing protein [Prevotella sp.]|nr:DUF4369 domain-containing protein [Prevotella sp.]